MIRDTAVGVNAHSPSTSSRTLITRAPADSPGIFQTPDGYLHASIAAATRYLQSRTSAPAGRTAAKRPPRAVQRRLPTPAVPSVVPARVVRPVPVQAPALPDPRVVLSDLCRQLRHAHAELDAVPGITGPTWSAAYRYHCALRSRYAAPVARLKRLIAAHRDRFGLPLMPFWAPKRPTADDRKIERQYDPEQTPAGWPALTFTHRNAA